MPVNLIIATGEAMESSLIAGIVLAATGNVPGRGR